MTDDGRDIVMIFNHLLVVATALVRRSRFDVHTHHDINFEEFSLVARPAEPLLVLDEELHIGNILR